jgi:hypothetical protein
MEETLNISKSLLEKWIRSLEAQEDFLNETIYVKEEIQEFLDTYYDNELEPSNPEDLSFEKNITKYSDYLNESTIEIEDSEEGVYVLTLHDIHNIVNSFTDTEILEDAIVEELQDYKFVKVDDPSIEKIGVDLEPIEELSSDDENTLFIKKFEE